MLEVTGLTKEYTSGLVRRERKVAVHDVSFRVEDGETLGLIGESGCGKTSIAMMLAHLLPATAGAIRLGGQDVGSLRGRELRAFRQQVQIIFQHPETALDPSMKIKASILEALRVNRVVPARSAQEAALLSELIATVGLQAEHLERYPWELSGGQVQRAVLARIIALKPSVLIADEPTSMLDVSVQAQILSLIRRLQGEIGFALVLISHDLDVVRCMCDKVVVMREGAVVESGTVDEVLSHPSAAYTRQLVDEFYAL